MTHFLLLRWISYLAILVICGEAGWAQTNQVGSAAPTPILVTFDGQYQYFSKLYYSGDERPREPRSVVVLNFMGLKCAPCRKELPILLEVMRPIVARGREKGIPIRFFLVSTDPLSSKEPLKEFLEEQGIDLATEVLLDPYKKAAEKFGVTNIPRTIVVSAQGRITADITGAGDDYKSLLRSGIRAALKEGVGQTTAKESGL
jgi:thiol-disulfide isomerase/thioredoxin